MGIERYFDLSGKVALVTGAASVPKVSYEKVLSQIGAPSNLIEAAREWERESTATNLGSAFAEAMAEAGADIVICDKNVEGLRETEEKIIKMGRKCLSLICDVTDEIQVSKMIQDIVNHYGHLDILINNAGIAGVAKMIHEYSTEEWNEVIAVNLQGVFYCCREALKVMVQQKSGKIINIASIWGLAGSSSIIAIPAYCAAKGAVANLTRELGLEYATYGINVNAICPGFFISGIANRAYENPDFVKAVLGFIPMGKLAFPE
ncbi:MAG TPA: SDR family NAD(P)-dependent oxidoreductase, partial [Deltaproteobacteria bacterium]|nr:SDR family NAD(P)-dependent oxidoreductase [Deltaproteobacteria bacterium]